MKHQMEGDAGGGGGEAYKIKKKRKKEKPLHDNITRR